MLFTRIIPTTVLRPAQRWSSLSPHHQLPPHPPLYSPAFHRYDACVHAANTLQTPTHVANMQEHPPLRFHGKRVSVWWDFDNLAPCGGTGAAVIMAQRITVCQPVRAAYTRCSTRHTQRAVLQHGGTLEQVRVYGNGVTMTKHHVSMRLLAGLGATTVCVGNKKYDDDTWRHTCCVSCQIATSSRAANTTTIQGGCRHGHDVGRVLVGTANRFRWGCCLGFLRPRVCPALDAGTQPGMRNGCSWAV